MLRERVKANELLFLEQCKDSRLDNFLQPHFCLVVACVRPTTVELCVMQIYSGAMFTTISSLLYASEIHVARDKLGQKKRQ